MGHIVVIVIGHDPFVHFLHKEIMRISQCPCKDNIEEGSSHQVKNKTNSISGTCSGHGPLFEFECAVNTATMHGNGQDQKGVRHSFDHFQITRMQCLFQVCLFFFGHVLLDFVRVINDKIESHIDNQQDNQVDDNANDVDYQDCPASITAIIAVEVLFASHRSGGIVALHGRHAKFSWWNLRRIHGDFQVRTFVSSEREE
mmetsp:Transcript_16575/g.40524  ORF Transcript_16575/g.40524 Transcript_16575/m.40524 type:complete len:200 (+) Transcript_16575:174-773(+)